MTRKFPAMALAAIIAVAGVGARAELPALTHIRLGYSNVSGFTPMFVAKDQGMFAKHGLEVEPILSAVNSTMPAALVGGSIQIAGTTPPVFLQAVEGGLDLVIIAGCSTNNTAESGQGVVARTGSGIKSPKDFEGKRVGVPGIGSYMHVLFRRWLVEKGVNEKSVNFVEVPFAQGGDILRAGNIDAMLTSDPYYSRIVAAKSGYLVAHYLQDMPDGLFSLYFTATREWAKRNTAIIKAFRDSIVQGIVYTDKEPLKARQILGVAMKLPPESVATIIIPKMKIQVPQSDLKYWIDTLFVQGVLRTHPDPARLIVN